MKGVQIMNAIKTKAMGIASKVTGSKVYKAVEKTAVAGSVALMGIGVSAMNTFAAEIDNTIQNEIVVNTADILNKAQPFITPAITILCCVGGMKLGMRFLRSSMH